MSESSKVCVLIPVFNDQAGLNKTLHIMASDSFPYDIVVVDDGSDSPIVCADQYGCHAVILIRLEKNLGIEHGLNAGLEYILKACYQYVARLDAGDIPMENRIDRQVNFLEQNPDVGIVGTWAKCVSDDGSYLFTLRFPTSHEGIIRKHRYLPALLHPAVMIRADALREIDLYSDRYKAAEDFDLFVRISRKYRAANIPEVLTEYVVSRKGITSVKRRRTLVSRLRVQIDNFYWRDLHSYLGVGRTVLLMGLPFSMITALKGYVWR
ncbi:glycosyltransferase [Microvirga aerilata]|uniref:Glycosyltransferase n=1 Tax=Microvirga aerilata TaxID=670292 RepID=A0A936ZMR0_9HYPH|nr:glycosyltransferase [Microvirga aerilata]MBL0407453.1 glycosyltransferase [Microvirga aerilata]